MRLSDGRSAFVKTRPHAPAGFFAVEARGLRWLAEPSGVRVPAVLAVAEDCLILSWIEPGRRAPTPPRRFARGLAAHPRCRGAGVRRQTDGYIGIAPLPTRPTTLAGVLGDRRVLPYLRAARDRGRDRSDADAEAVEQVVGRIDELAGPAEPPARLHGDLWSGNIVWARTARRTWSTRRPTAATGRPTWRCSRCSAPPTCTRLLDAYDEADPLADGWRTGSPLHQLIPLLVHAALFGGRYGRGPGGGAPALLDGGRRVLGAADTP